jgi:hypothetical protein
VIPGDNRFKKGQSPLRILFLLESKLLLN